jgi:hypothetical protein
MDKKSILDACAKDIWVTIFVGCASFWILLISGGVGIYFIFKG